MLEESLQMGWEPLKNSDRLGTSLLKGDTFHVHFCQERKIKGIIQAFQIK